MAARFKTILYTFTSTDPVSLSTILNSPRDSYVGSIVLRAGAGNTGNVLWQDAVAGSAGGFLDASEAASFDIVDKYVSTDVIFLVGSTNDTVYITVLN